MAAVAFLAGTALAGGGAVGVQCLASPDTGVTVHSEPKKSRADYIRLWEAELAKSGRTLPAGTDRMTTQEIMDAWTSERAKYAEPS
ncbi:hypothetical protein [Streptomyces sp. NPDC059909]|uniref:hypothetical protein n=1 Tax=Streptomyces sp. NPDC059909 TaxID=3346998 RepID=UPI00366903BE